MNIKDTPVGSYLKVKNLTRIPSYWNDEGRMNHLRGKAVKILGFSTNSLGFRIQDPTSSNTWYIKFEDFEPETCLSEGDIDAVEAVGVKKTLKKYWTSITGWGDEVEDMEEDLSTTSSVFKPKFFIKKPTKWPEAEKIWREAKATDQELVEEFAFYHPERKKIEKFLENIATWRKTFDKDRILMDEEDLDFLDCLARAGLNITTR